MFNLSGKLHERILQNKKLFSAPLAKLPGEASKHGYKFIDNGGDILAVAHTDTVCKFKWLYADARYIASPVLDNRIGVYIALVELKRRGIVADILLTTGEESGMSTAYDFKTSKRYNWIAEFDRSGEDCAMYQFKNPETSAAVKSAGFNPVMGSYTDIVELENLGCAGFNFGVGYNNYHSDGSYIETPLLADLIDRFENFYWTNKDRRFEYKPGSNRKTKYEFEWVKGGSFAVKGGASGWESADWGHTIIRRECEVCNRTSGKLYATKWGSVCPECAEFIGIDVGGAPQEYIDLCEDCSAPADSSVVINGCEVMLCNTCIKYYQEFLESESEVVNVW